MAETAGEAQDLYWELRLDAARQRHAELVSQYISQALPHIFRTAAAMNEVRICREDIELGRAQLSSARDQAEAEKIIKIYERDRLAAVRQLRETQILLVRVETTWRVALRLSQRDLASEEGRAGRRSEG